MLWWLGTIFQASRRESRMASNLHLFVAAPEFAPGNGRDGHRQVIDSVAVTRYPLGRDNSERRR